MKQTVVGLFDKQSDAQHAVEQLLKSGFTNDNVDISSGNSNTSSDTANASGGTTTSSTYASGNTGSGTAYSSGNTEHESGIKRFFKNLFGDDDNDAEK